LFNNQPDPSDNPALTGGIFLALILPNGPDELGLFIEIIALAVAPSRYPSAGRADRCTVGICYLVILITAITAEVVHFLSIIPIQVYLSGRIPFRLLFYRVDPLLNTGRDRCFALPFTFLCGYQ
jgi:hypothetical protein